MKPLVEILEKKISEAMEKVSGVSSPVAAVRASQDERFGDFQANGIMGLAKRLKQKGRDLAGKVIDELELGDMCESIKIAGPGFINIILRGTFLSQKLVEISNDDKLGIDEAESPETVVVDFSCPNIAKEMHVGHIRSTIIGDSISRLLEVHGHNVRRINHIGDWGTQFGMLIQYLRRKYPEAVKGEEKLSISDLEDFYRQAKVCFDEEPEFADASRKEVTKLQAGASDSLKAWKTICNVSRGKFQEIYDLLNIKLEEMGESFYNPFLPEIVDDLLKRGIASESDGAVCVFVKGIDAPFMIRKRDGGYGYATTDLAALRYRVGEFGANRIIYVTDARQKDHFRQLFKAARSSGYASDDIRLEHAAFGAILGKDGKPLKTRSSKNVLLKDIILEAVNRAHAVVKAKNPGITMGEMDNIARIVGIGALKYMDLRQNIISDYVFDWDRMLALEGDTAPYLQYAYARIRSIFRKGDLNPEDFRTTAPELSDRSELRLGKHLVRYNEIVAQAANECRPNMVANYLYELASRFTSFYTMCPVLKAEEKVRNSRLMLCDITSRIIRHGLGLLGIEVSERM